MTRRMTYEPSTWPSLWPTSTRWPGVPDVDRDTLDALKDALAGNPPPCATSPDLFVSDDPYQRAHAITACTTCPARDRAATTPRPPTPSSASGAARTSHPRPTPPGRNPHADPVHTSPARADRDRTRPRARHRTAHEPAAVDAGPARRHAARRRRARPRPPRPRRRRRSRPARRAASLTPPAEPPPSPVVARALADRAHGGPHHRPMPRS